MDSHFKNKNFTWYYRTADHLQRFVNPGMLLMLVSIFTVFLANSHYGNWYASLWHTEFFLGTEHFNLLNHSGHPLTLLELINDGIMAIFFFSVGLEIKREVLVGELSSFRQALLPIIAAVGGMVMPVLFFYISGQIQGFDAEQMKGMAIPMATDIAFSLAVLGLLGKRVPLSLKIFLLALAIADDIGGIVVIAMFYSSFTTESLIYLGLAIVAFLFLIAGNKLSINHKAFYGILGVVVWYLFLQSGIHPSIAGVLVALTVPARPRLNLGKFVKHIERDIETLKATCLNQSQSDEMILSNIQIRHLTHIEKASDTVISPLQDIEDNMHGFINFVVMPLFAFANAGVILNFGALDLHTGISMSVMVGLVLGKVVGISLFTWIAVKLGISHLPAHMSWVNLIGIATLGGIGFTVALFLSGLSYPLGSEMLNQAKMGVIFGSLVAGILGYSILRFSLKKQE